MSETIKRFRAVGIYNTHEILLRFANRENAVAVSYHASQGRGDFSRTQVWSPHFNTDPNAAWYNYGCKSFGGIRSISFLKALAWASQKYGVESWKPSPLSASDYIPEQVRKAAMEYLAT